VRRPSIYLRQRAGDPSGPKDEAEAGHEAKQSLTNRVGHDVINLLTPVNLERV